MTAISPRAKRYSNRTIQGDVEKVAADRIARQHDKSPRDFVWVSINGEPAPCIWPVPRVGGSAHPVLAERRLEAHEHTLSIDDLVKLYPAPPTTSEDQP